MSKLTTTNLILPPVTSQEAKARLDAQAALIQVRAEALHHEVMTTGDAVKDAVAENPWVGVGGGLAGGVVVGLMFGGRGEQKAARPLTAVHIEEEPPPLIGSQPQPGIVRTAIGVAFTALVSAVIRQGIYKLIGNDEEENVV